MKKRKIAVYIRVAYKEQLNENINYQKQLIEKYLKMQKNYTVIGYYIDDGYSGLNLRRPMLEKMLEEVKKGNVNEILVSNYSRISRNILELDNFVSKNLVSQNIKLISVEDNSNYYDMEQRTRGNLEKEIKKAKRRNKNMVR